LGGADIDLTFYVFAREHDIGDFAEVARRIRARDRRIAAHVCDTTHWWPMGLRSVVTIVRPTLSIEMARVRTPPLRGQRLRHRKSGGKLKQYERLAAAGICVPKTVAITPGLALDPDEWGSHVVVKPDRGRRGAFVWIRRVRKVRYEPPESLPADHPGRRGGMIAQQFIYTGPWPTAYRVLSYFGRALSCLRYEGRRDLPPLSGADGFAGGGGRSIVASAAGNRISLANDADVLDLARRVHAVTPDIPSLGIDIVRDAGDGRLYVLETNPSGNSWTLGGETGRKMQRDNGIDFYSQFGALDVIAERTIELALQLAEKAAADGVSPTG
jgi:hypothetical protein